MATNTEKKPNWFFLLPVSVCGRVSVKIFLKIFHQMHFETQKQHQHKHIHLHTHKRSAVMWYDVEIEHNCSASFNLHFVSKFQWWWKGNRDKHKFRCVTVTVSVIAHDALMQERPSIKSTHQKCILIQTPVAENGISIQNANLCRLKTYIMPAMYTYTQAHRREREREMERCSARWRLHGKSAVPNLLLLHLSE